MDIGWIFLGIFAFICFCVLVTTAFLYYKMNKEKSSPLDQPMGKLRTAMATGLRNNDLITENPLKVAEEVTNLPQHIADAENLYNERKVKYQNLFKKGAKSSGGWKLFGKNLYYISKGKKTWYDAENFCMSRDAHLASILTDEEQTYITSQLTTPAWIGLTDESEEGNWEWTDGSRLITQYWSAGNPNSWENYGDTEEEDCASIIPSTREKNWSECNCHELHTWVCKESLDTGEL
ncbi:CD209 antigen-like protein C [Zootoca vivipara]|uniref:CD209 antigen-like protein C n=1 Tax=Zootoca vivipara TaxID=8524 RepID=UPI00293BE6D6|nr:CD209 antigen-like protein C [Zootoca vivipara]